MKPWKSYSNTFPLAGKYVEIRIRIEVEPSDLSLEDLGIDAAELAGLNRELERGDLMLADVTVSATYAGITGTDSLEAVFVRSPEDVEDSLIENDMEENARAELLKELAVTYETLLNLFETQTVTK